MKLYFEQTPEHFQELITANFRKSKGRKFFIYLLLAIVLLGINLYFFDEDLSDQDLFGPIVGWVFPFLIIILFSYLIFKFFYKKSVAQNNPKLFGWQEVELTDERVLTKNNFSESVYKWSAFKKAVETDKYRFLYFDKNQALIIPKIAFENDNQRTEFEALINSKIQSK